MIKTYTQTRLGKNICSKDSFSVCLLLFCLNNNLCCLILLDFAFFPSEHPRHCSIVLISLGHLTFSPCRLLLPERLRSLCFTLKFNILTRIQLNVSTNVFFFLCPFDLQVWLVSDDFSLWVVFFPISFVGFLIQRHYSSLYWIIFVHYYHISSTYFNLLPFFPVYLSWIISVILPCR